VYLFVSTHISSKDIGANMDSTMNLMSSEQRTELAGKVSRIMLGMDVVEAEG
jgi:hypothetical protein